MPDSQNDPRMLVGRPYPLGVTLNLSPGPSPGRPERGDGHRDHTPHDGANFAIFSEHATAVDLCLFDRPDGRTESARYRLPGRTDQVWHGFLPDIQPGQLYGYRVHGPYAPEQGHRFNPNKLLIDPYAQALAGELIWDDAVHGYVFDEDDNDLSFDERDSAPFVPKGIVIADAFDWEEDRQPDVPWTDTVIYECHVKGLTALHPEVPERLRGTYLGLASEPIIDHLKYLGVTAVELLPIHHAVDERRLVNLGLVNYWAYSTIAYFAPCARYATGSLGQQVHEFKSMVKALHAAGIEVILDVVYNHTAEVDVLGPTLSMRGIDSASYYHLRRDAPRFYEDFTGCGNSLNLSEPRTLQLVMDSLRYWVCQMHVDGFRFDLATVLGRGRHGFNRNAPFFAAVQQDPVLAGVKLLAEPWDLGDGGYRVGHFRTGWAEWNDKFRSTMRSFWRGDHVSPGDLSARVSGSSDLFKVSGRSPTASVNFITAHDGFTLHDLVSYEQKHNEANGEESRDGEGHNLSCNWGVEGPTDDARIADLREQIKRGFIAALAFSLGVPMITAGDEMGRTQQGNNNAYCQDNEITWVHWNLDDRQRQLLAFSRDVLRLRRECPILRRGEFLRGESIREGALKDVTWFRPDGQEMTGEDWHGSLDRMLGMLIHGSADDADKTPGSTLPDQTLLVIFNGSSEAHMFQFPSITGPGTWTWLVSTAHARPRRSHARGRSVRIASRSLALLEFKRTE